MLMNMSFSGCSGSGILGSDVFGAGASGLGGVDWDSSGLLRWVPAEDNIPFLHQEWHW